MFPLQYFNIVACIILSLLALNMQDMKPPVWYIIRDFPSYHDGKSELYDDRRRISSHPTHPITMSFLVSGYWGVESTPMRKIRKVSGVPVWQLFCFCSSWALLWPSEHPPGITVDKARLAYFQRRRQVSRSLRNVLSTTARLSEVLELPASHEERGGGDPDSPLYRDQDLGEGSMGHLGAVVLWSFFSKFKETNVYVFCYEH